MVCLVVAVVVTVVVAMVALLVALLVVVAGALGVAAFFIKVLYCLSSFFNS